MEPHGTTGCFPTASWEFPLRLDTDGPPRNLRTTRKGESHWAQAGALEVSLKRLLETSCSCSGAQQGVRVCVRVSVRARAPGLPVCLSPRTDMGAQISP